MVDATPPPRLASWFWTMGGFGRALFLVGAPLFAVIMGLSALAAYNQGPGNERSGYVTGMVSATGCRAHVATAAGVPATLEVTLRRGRYGCAASAGQRIYYDPSTRQEVPGPSNHLVGAVLLGFLAVAALVFTVLLWRIRLSGRPRGSEVSSYSYLA